MTNVGELIDPTTEQWDTQLLNQIFCQEDVKIIRSIPVHAELEDVVGWHFDDKGIFSVKSAYKVHRASEARRQNRNMVSGSGGRNAPTEFWRKLWKTDCAPKIKHFLWRLSHNTIAVRRVLQRRGMKIDTRCCVCGRLDEDGGHLFLKCKEVKKLWREMNLEDVRCRLIEAASAKEMIEMILTLKEKEQNTVITLLWLWWDERNKRREEGRQRDTAELAYTITARSDTAPKESANRLLPDFCQRDCWLKPSDGELKINSDGAFDKAVGAL